MDYDKIINEAQELINEEKFLRAFETLKPAADEIDDIDYGESYIFFEPFETVLFKYNHPKYKFTLGPNPFAPKIYELCSFCLETMGRQKEAINYIKKAMKLRPVDARYALMYMDNLRELSKLEKFMEFGKDYFKYVYRPEDIVDFYRCFSYYFTEKDRFKEAAVCLILSSRYQNTALLQSEISMVEKAGGIEPNSLTKEDVERIANENEIPLGPDENTINIAVSLGKKALAQYQMEAAKYFLGIAYDLTNDPYIKMDLDRL